MGGIDIAVDSTPGTTGRLIYLEDGRRGDIPYGITELVEGLSSVVDTAPATTFEVSGEMTMWSTDELGFTDHASVSVNAAFPVSVTVTDWFPAVSRVTEKA